MKTKMFKLIVIISIFCILPVFAQDNEMQKFVGIWTPSKTEGSAWLGNMKITLDNGKLLVQIKKNGEIQKCEDVKIDGNTIRFRCKSEIHLYGSGGVGTEDYYKIFKWNIYHIYWEDQHRIEGNLGKATEVFCNVHANRIVNSCIFSAELVDDNLKLSVKFNDAYYLGDIHGFSQETDWSFYSTYTNW